MNFLYTILFFHTISATLLFFIFFAIKYKKGQRILNKIYQIFIVTLFSWLLLDIGYYLLFYTKTDPSFLLQLELFFLYLLGIEIYLFSEFFSSILRYATLRILFIVFISLISALFLLFYHEPQNTNFSFFRLIFSLSLFLLLYAISFAIFIFKFIYEIEKTQKEIKIILIGSSLTIFSVLFTSLIFYLKNISDLYFIVVDVSVLFVTLTSYAYISQNSKGGFFSLKLPIITFLSILLAFFVSIVYHLGELLLINKKNFDWGIILSYVFLFLIGLYPGNRFIKFLKTQIDTQMLTLDTIVSNLFLMLYPGKFKHVDLGDILSETIDLIFYKKYFPNHLVLIFTENGNPFIAYSGATPNPKLIYTLKNLKIEEINENELHFIDKEVHYDNFLKSTLENYNIYVPISEEKKRIGFILLYCLKDTRFLESEEVENLQAIKKYIFCYMENLLFYTQFFYEKSKVEEEILKLTEMITQRDVSSKDIEGKKIVYKSAAMQNVIEKAKQIAPLSQPVLITGETGTGKELIARLLHNFENKKDSPFIAVNSATLPASLWEDEIFGHIKGAFTDAKSDRKGKVEEAENGTLFLDEIGDMPYEMQAKLLRLLQEREYNPIGGQKKKIANCRFIFATNRNIEELIKKGSFREDLYYRINVFSIYLPPLRERKEDISALVNYFIARFSEELNMAVPTIEKEAMDILCSYEYLGNVRELENMIIRALASSRNSSKLLPMDLPIKSLHSNSYSTKKSQEILNINGNYEKLIEDYSQRLISLAMEKADGNRTKAAEILGIKRGKLNYHLKNS